MTYRQPKVYGDEAAIYDRFRALWGAGSLDFKLDSTAHKSINANDIEDFASVLKELIDEYK